MSKSFGIKLIILWGISLIVIFAFSFYSVRKSVLKPAKERAYTVAEVVRSSLTTLMLTNAMDKRDIFLAQIMDMENLEEVRVLRGEAVIRQFGKGKHYEEPVYTIEREVLAYGRPKEELIESIERVLYRVVIPYKAEPTPSVNCMACHNVKRGEVLGAISITMDITPYRNFGLFVWGTLVGTISLVGFISLFIVWKNFKSLSSFLQEITNLFNQFERGNFGVRINLSNVERDFLPLANRINEVVSSLNGVLRSIREKVYTLLGYNLMETENEVRDTEKIIDELVRISQFKKTIELDATKEDVYRRIESVLSDYMSLDKFSIYEVTDSNTIEKVAVRGRDTWCANVIFEKPEECRAKRTGQDVDSEEFRCICPNFIMCEENAENFCYYCIPVNVGGKVGNVIQIVYEKQIKDFIKLIIPYIKGYLREASPVLESKRLMEQLRKQSYIDKLTGAFNRRFLEDIVDKLVAQAQRRNSNIGVLMVDVDFFKEVNDTFGHDAGDEVLRQVAKAIKESIRKSDYLIRYGGEEFLVLLTDVKDGYAEQVAEKIRKRIEETPIKLPNGTVIRKTVSIGVSEFPKDCNGKFWQCVKFADVALYKAKEEGRNRVVRFKPEMWQEEEY
ncbi:GGDEF domain-containing protein [Aquifex pyrophilus]